MKPEFPKPWAQVSVWIATPLLFLCTVVYIQHSFNQPAAKMLPIGLSAFGVTAALSGLCFSMARAIDNSHTAKYAGEKFLHSAILLIQSLFLIYLRDAVIESEWIKSWPSFVLPVEIFLSAVLTIVTFMSAFSWYHGFAELNLFLWKNWEQRVRDLNARMKDKEP